MKKAYFSVDNSINQYHQKYKNLRKFQWITFLKEQKLTKNKEKNVKKCDCYPQTNVFFPKMPKLSTKYLRRIIVYVLCKSYAKTVYSYKAALTHALEMDAHVHDRGI